MIALFPEEVKKGSEGNAMRREVRETNEAVGALVKKFADHTIAFYDNLDAQPVCRSADDGTLVRLQEMSVPKEGRPLQDVYHEMISDI